MNSPVTNQTIDQIDNLFDSNPEVYQPENPDTNLANPATNLDPSPDINLSISHNPSPISSPDINPSISQRISLDPHHTTNQVLVITGMHRSGTSLMASFLESAGLDVGERLLMENDSNPKGHYEDLDFVNFHEDVLDAQGFNTAGWTLERSLPIADLFLPRVRSLLEQHQSKTLWGWKDPRTVLFLDFWQQNIPHAKFLFVYRQPWEVMDSLFRRGNSTFVKNPNFALEVWQHYNQIILEFCQAFPERSILFSLDTITQDPSLLTQAIQDKLGICLQIPETSRYDQSLLKREVSHHALLVQSYFPEAIDLYNQLQKHSLHSSTNPAPLIPTETSPNSYKAWIAKDWVDYCGMERHRNGLELEVVKIHDQLVQAHKEIAQAHAEITQAHTYAHAEITQAHTLAHAEITQAQAIHQQAQTALEQQIQNTRQELAEVQVANQQVHQQLLATQADLQQAQAQLAQLHAVIQGMESSKFWLLRRIWFKFKQVFGWGEK